MTKNCLTAVTIGVRKRLERLRPAVPRKRRHAVLRQIAERSADRPLLDQRPADEILGYDHDGLPS